ncbi:unnamed protein product [Calypogeia fissa]
MDGLERWHRLYPGKLELSLSDIIPFLSDYLAEVENVEVSDALPSVDQSAESSNNPGEVANLSRPQLARLRQTRAKENQPGPFELIQLRVQKFLGKIGHFNHHLVQEVNLLQVVGSGGLAWDSVDRVQFTLPFRDEKYDIWLDSLLPRVVELALSSSDRRTKVTASELLQALCLIMLGNSAKGPVRRKNESSHSVRLDKLYTRLFPAILRLAVDVEVVTRQLFNEFAKQLIHWYTSNQQRENPETVALLDAILDGLVDAENGSLREFCAACFGEFMSWSVRHAPPETNDFVNVKSILRRLYNRMDHPNPYKRLGASMAAYRIYPVLRGTPSIVDRYIFEMIFFCIKSLRLAEGDDSQIGTAKQLNKTLDNYLKLVERNISALQCARKDRPVFLTLENFLEWLLQQTWQLQEMCRTKCMSALSFICRSLPVGSSAGWFRSGSMQSTMIPDRMKAFAFEVDNLFETIENSLDEAVHQLSLFVRSFHWFTWALKDKLVTVQELQMNAKGDLIVKKFLQRIITASESSSQWSAVTPGQREAHQKLKCSATIHFLGFVKQILDNEFGFLNKGFILSRDVSKGTANTGVLEDLIPASEPKFHEVMCLALLRPRDLGFVMTDLRQSEELARLALGVMQMLTVASDGFKLGLTRRLQAMFNENKSKYDLSTMNLSMDTLGYEGAIGIEDAISLLKGYQQLHLSGSLLPVLGKEEGKKMGENILMRVVGIGRECPPALESVASEMLSLSIALGVKAEQLVEVCLDEKIITSSTNARKVTAGGVFYLNFRKVIVRQVKFSFEDCGVTLLNAAVKNQTARLILNAVLDDYIGSIDGKNLTLGSFLEETLSHLKLLQPCSTSSSGLADKQFLLEIFHKLLSLDTSFDLLQQHQSALQFIEDSYIAFLSAFHHPDDSGTTSGSTQRDANFALKSQSLVLLRYFFGRSFDQDLQSRIAGALTKVVSDHLLLRETDLHTNSHQRSSYLQMLSRLLDSVSVSGSLILLEVIFPLLLHPPKVAARKLSETLDRLAESIGEKREGAFDLCIQILNDDTKLPQLKRAVIEKVFSALVKAAPVDFVATWYSSRIEAFVENFGKQTSNADADKEEETLMSKICHYYLVEQLFLKVAAPIIKEKITPLASNALLMKQTMGESRAKNDPVKLFSANSNLWRELHVSAYNCLAAIALRTQEHEKIFSVLFKEGPTGMIWQHLIDTDKVYDSFPVETSKSNLAYQTVREMRANQKAGSRQHGTVSSSLSTLSSQYFAGTGLSQEPALINTFVSRGGVSESRSDTASIGMSLNLGVDDDTAEEIDGGNHSSLKESDSGPEVIDRLDLDQDDFDLHPCMPVVLRLIETLYTRFGAGRGDMPEWMKGLYSTMQNSATQMNVRLFLTKVLIKAWRVFSPYCQTWFVPMVQSILLDPAKSGGMSFHYMLRDICITVLQWKLASPPDAGVASAFVNHLISVAAHGSIQVLRANVDIIRLFIGSWKGDLQLEKRIILNYLCAGGKAASSSDRVIRMQRIVGLQLLGVIVVSELPMYDPFRDQFSEKDLYHALLQNLSFKGKEVYEASGELLGIALKQRKETSQDPKGSREEELLEGPLKQCLLNYVRDGNLDCFLNILNKITLRFPSYIEGFASVLIDILPKLPGVFKTIALDIFLRYPACITSCLNMLLPSLIKLLTHRDELAQLRSLQLLMELVKNGPDKRIMERVLPVLCETFPSHESVDCRQQYYHVLTSLYEIEGVNTNRLIVRSLLAGLIDTADVIRLRIQNFWHLHLSQDLGHRLTQMINDMYDPAVEEFWAQFTNVLLLKLCEDSVDFKRPIFNAPLSDCEFHEQTINTSWSGSSSLPMTPLFSQSQNIPQGSQESLSQVVLSSQDGSGTVPRGAHMIRATFTSTLTQTHDTMASSTQASQESALFAMSRRSTRTQREATMQDSMTLDDSAVPRRRILHADAAKSQIIRGVMNANRRREARAKQQATERGNKVHMMRRYRIGELPDIEIKYEEILIPLAALAQNDATFARLLLTLICRAIYACQPNTPLKNKQGDIKSSMKEGIEKALENTHNGISFVGCLEALCLEDSEIWIHPKVVGSASLKSTNFHSGIVVLEMEILHENSKDGPYPGTSSKRHKGAAGTPTTREKTNLEEAWLELARLYSELGEDDVVLSLYRKNLTKKPTTHQALEAQLGGDPGQGLTLYDQALDTLYNNTDDNSGVSGIEQDIWYNQRLVCLAELNRWDLILADTVEQVKDEDESSDPDLKRLWDPSLQEPYLGLFMRGAVKVATYRSMAADFIQSSLEEPGKRDILMKQYGSQLAQLAVENDQLDRARFLLSNCYRHFRKQWSALHPLAVGARRRQLQKLQKMVELDEFTDVMAGRQVTEIPRKLQEWRHRWPSSRDDGVEVWEDIIQSRLVFFNKFQGLVNKQLKSELDDVQSTFASKLEEERAHIFRQAAGSLTKQGAYSVAEKYMQEYIAARQLTNRKDKLDYESTKGLVKLQLLKANRIQNVQAGKSTQMFNEVLSYIKSSAQKPGVEEDSMIWMNFKLLEANASVQLAWNNLGCLPKTDPDPSAVKQCLSLLGAAYVAYSDVFTKLSVSDESSVHPKTSRRLAKSSLKFGQFCDELLKFTKNEEWSNDVRAGVMEGDSTIGLPPASIYPTLIVKHMMTAATLDTSLRAQHGVARILSLVSQYPETHADFPNQVKQVPSWVFMPWIPQMLAVMDQEEGKLFVGLLEEIARLYPHALYFPFHVSEKDFGRVGQKRTLVLAKLLKNDFMQGFVRALEDLTYPEQRLRDGFAQIKNHLAASNREKAKALFADLVEDCLDVDVMSQTWRQAGEYNCKFARDWSKRVKKALGDDGGKLLHMDEKGFMAAVKDLMANLQKAMQGLQTGVISLAHLSKWMAKFDQSTSASMSQQSSQESGTFVSRSESSASDAEFAIEIPGQYNGFHEPSHLSHVKLVGFDQTLISLSSKQRPKVLTMRGSDEKDYKFVVKGGEDIRLDQRIEQLFEVMNSILARNPASSHRGLSIRTYAVVPVSKSCGLLQFVENTCVLEDVVKDGLISKLPDLSRQGKDAATAFLQKLRTVHNDWIQRRGGPSKSPYEGFTNLYKKAGFDEVNQMLTSIQSQLPWDTFRAGVSRWATSAESYLALRSQFAKSLSVVSICGYIAGVGDRHLANTLVDMRSGSLVPIDFGYSFGTGVILLPVPELIPFRLTNQLTNFLLPLDAIGLLRTDMVHTLSALHQSRDMISAVMDIFVKEPLVDWKNEAMKTNSIREKEDGSDQMEANLEQQYVELKVANAQRKLQLWNPAAITIAELQSSIHANKPYLPALEAIVRGSSSRNVRARINGEKCQSIQEQVDCLIDQATDPNLLGRIWTGWQAWV